MTIDLPAVNEFERKQIERAIDKRKRYRYVRPTVRMVSNGILVESPCCSRRVDEAGGMVDVALLQRLPSGRWRMYCKDHSTASWKLHTANARLTDLLDSLKNDPDRIFWP
jgi:hypothetical protein